MEQNPQWFHGQLRVNRTNNEELPPSLGGRYTPVSKSYFSAACDDIFIPDLMHGFMVQTLINREES
jgi:hypothetical protein